MAEGAPLRVRVMGTVQFLAAMAILLWTTSGWPQDEAKSAPSNPISATAEDRKSFAEAENRRVEKALAEMFRGDDAPVSVPTRCSNCTWPASSTTQY